MNNKKRGGESKGRRVHDNRDPQGDQGPTDRVNQAVLRGALEQGIGDLKASLLLDFVLKEIGPSVYNQAVADAQARMAEMVDEIDGTCYEPEFGYWERHGP